MGDELLLHFVIFSQRGRAKYCAHCGLRRKVQFFLLVVVLFLFFFMLWKTEV